MNATVPLLSIITPTFNREFLLSETMASIMTRPSWQDDAYGRPRAWAFGTDTACAVGR